MQEWIDPNSARLTQADVDRLAADPSPESRRLLAAKLGHSYVGGLTPEARRIADDVIRALARDVEQEVRAALSRTIAMSTELPRDIALALARDVAEVAVPLLTISDLLDDADLVDIIASHGEAHRAAIAARARISEDVAEALVDSDDRQAIRQLVSNPGARIRENSLHRIVERHGDDHDISTPLVERVALPLSVAERLVERVSERLRAHWAREGRPVDRLSMPVGESVAMLLSDPGSDALDVLSMVERLHSSGLANTRLMQASARAGDRTLTAALAARLSATPFATAQDMLLSGNERSALKLLARTGLDRDDARGLLSHLEKLS